MLNEGLTWREVEETKSRKRGRKLGKRQDRWWPQPADKHGRDVSQTEYDFDFSPHFTLGCQIAFCSDDISFTGKKVERLRNEAAAALHARHEEWHHHLCSFPAIQNNNKTSSTAMQLMTPTPSDFPIVPIFAFSLSIHDPFTPDVPTLRCRCFCSAVYSFEFYINAL